ncbi:MAG: hypothetical protein N0E44_18245 [Candidatus Thiodiazotropha lotti]|nr:hypothetical protein [Candidatus Thiodiazotropha lotti]MCW4221825.1 hypothetical protein [Candidatus Thiodiazotropha lotti]
MAMSWTGLGRGLERGIRLRMAMDQHEMNKDRAEEDANARKQQRILTDMQIEKLKDTNEREQTLRATNQTLYHLGSLKSDPQGYANQLQTDPEMNTSVSESINRVGQMLVDARGIGDGMQREFAGFTPTDDGRLMVNLRVTKEDGSVYEPPLTESGSTDPDDPVLAFTLDDLGGLTAAIDAEIKGLESKKVGLGDMSPANARKAEIGRKQGIADEKDMLKYEYGLKGQLEKAKAKNKEKSGASTKAKHQAELESQGLPKNVARGIAYGTFKQIKDEFGMTTAIVDMATSKTVGTLVEQGDSYAFQPNPEWVSTGGISQASNNAEQQSTATNPTSKTYQGNVNGKSVTFTDADIASTAEKHGISVEAVKRQLNITE